MTYRECLDYFKSVSGSRTFDGLTDDSYLQFDLIGKENGRFYVHIDKGALEISEGEYKQRQVQFITTTGSLEKVLLGKMDPIYAYATGKLNIAGDVSLGRNFLSRISAKERAEN